MNKSAAIALGIAIVAGCATPPPETPPQPAPPKEEAPPPKPEPARPARPPVGSPEAKAQAQTLLRQAFESLNEGDEQKARAELDELHDRLYELEAAVEDVERDLAGKPTVTAYREAVEWLLTAARPLVQKRLLDRT